MVVSTNFSIPPSALVSRFKGGFTMGKTIKNDYELTAQLTAFFKRVRSVCDYSTPKGEYFAHIAKALSEQENSFFASLPVTSYGQLETPHNNNLPYSVNFDLLSMRVLSFVDGSRNAIAMQYPAMAKFAPSEDISQILSESWKVSAYGIITDSDEGLVIGKRHPGRIAQDALRQAARYNSDKLHDKAMYALECYIQIDTSLFEVFKRINACYDELWGEPDIDAPCDLLTLCNQFDPYGKKFNPQLDYRYKENNITSELILNVANLL